MRSRTGKNFPLIFWVVELLLGISLDSILWMGSDVTEVQETPLDISCIKVHQVLCTQLLSLLDRISGIFPDIEAVRPRCKSGIEALCLLQNAIEKARKLIQNCCESSKLYLALTGETIVSRFEKTKKYFVESLSEIQTMVPVVLQLQINEILNDLNVTKFRLDVHENEAGKALRALLEKDASVINSVGNSDTEVLQFAALRLHLTTQKDLLIERRSIRKQLNEVMEDKSTKMKTLKYLFYLLKKNEKLLLQGEPRNPPNLLDVSALSTKSSGKSLTPKCANPESSPGYAPVGTPADVLGYSPVRTPANMLNRPNPPEEFRCPLSSKLMYDPVVTSSGHTFERTHIQKWFDDGHDTCPKTRLKLDDLSVRPNTVMRDLISKWSMQHGILLSDPNVQTSVCDSLESSSNSISSNASSMRDLNLQIDISNLSIRSLDSSYSSDFSNPKVKRGFSSLRGPSKVDSRTFLFYQSVCDIRRQVLSNVNDLPWESQCGAIQDVKDYLIEYNPSCAFVSSENFVEPLVQFLKDALDKQDVEAQKAGIQLFLAFLKASREETINVSEDVYALLASFLGTNATVDTLAMLEILSLQPSALSSFVASGALTKIIKLLDDNNRELQAAATRILYSLSLSMDTHSIKFASNWIPKLVPILRESSVAGTCIGILENLSKFEVARVCIVQTDGCIASVVELLEAGSPKVQEHAITVLLSLCSQRDYYCRLVLREGVIPALCHVSVNGTDKGKISASELLRLLMDVKSDSEVERPRSNGNASVGHPEKSERKSSSKSSGSFGRKMKMFFKKK